MESHAFLRIQDSKQTCKALSATVLEDGNSRKEFSIISLKGYVVLHSLRHSWRYTHHSKGWSLSQLAQLECKVSTKTIHSLDSWMFLASSQDKTKDIFSWWPRTWAEAPMLKLHALSLSCPSYPPLCRGNHRCHSRNWDTGQSWLHTAGWGFQTWQLGSPL